LEAAEVYVDFSQHWDTSAIIDGATMQLFATDLGYRLRLDSDRPPWVHDCADIPVPNDTPDMCHRGNANFFPFGPQHGVLGVPLYQMSVVGTLQNAKSDPCLVPGVGDGCVGP
jgi:hypothetical protein